DWPRGFYKSLRKTRRNPERARNSRPATFLKVDIARSETLLSPRTKQRRPVRAKVPTAEIHRAEFQRSVLLIEPDGAVSFGAKAVFRSLRCRPSKKWLAWSYEHVPGFAAFSEGFYKILAAN